MTATFDIARDALASQFYNFWLAETPDLNDGTVVPVFWPGVVEPEPPPQTSPWARYIVNHVTGQQATLAAVGSRLFNRTGLVTIQIFSPINQEGGLDKLQQLAMIAKDAFEGKSTEENIWFRNVRIQEIGASGNLYQFNVLAEFDYDELK